MRSILLSLVTSLLLSGCGTNPDSTCIDAEGNKYSIKRYGQTVWMTENLKSQQDTSGSPITFYFPNNDSTNVQDFGLLYDFDTACKICPAGWQLPTKEDWVKMIAINGGNQASHYKDNESWKDEYNSNHSQFSAKPTGIGNNGEFTNHFNSKTLFWTSTKEEEHFIHTYIFELGNDTIRLASQHPTYAFSVRCIKSEN